MSCRPILPAALFVVAACAVGPAPAPSPVSVPVETSAPASTPAEALTPVEVAALLGPRDRDPGFPTHGAPTPPRPDVGNQVFVPSREDLPFEASEGDRAGIGSGFTGHRPAPAGSGYGRGLALGGVQPEGPLGQAGLKNGDLLLALGPIRLAADDPDPVGTFRRGMGAVPPEEETDVVYARGDEVVQTRVTPARRPPLFASAETPRAWFEPLPADDAVADLMHRAMALDDGAAALRDSVLATNAKRMAKTDWFRLRESVEAHLEVTSQEGLARTLGDAITEDASFAASLAAGQYLPAPSFDGAEGDVAGLVEEIAWFVTQLDATLRGHLADWTPAERDYLTQAFPQLVERMDSGEYLYDDPDVERQRASRRTVNLLSKVDRAVIADAASRTHAFLASILPALVEAAQADGRDGLLAEKQTDAGLVQIWGGGRQQHKKRCAFRFDLSGDDDYLDVGGRADLTQPVSIHVDWSGNDQYGATSRHVQGAAIGGVGVLIDVAGDDQYLATGWSQGAAVAGYGLLWDAAGEDIYRCLDVGQGAALVGAGVLVDRAGDDLYDGDRFCQGVGFGAGVGALVDHDGDDHYACTGRYGSEYGEPGLFSGWGQGVGFGFRHLTSGGIGLLRDRGGDDVYEAGNFSQGGGYHYAWGILHDESGDDRYLGSRYAMAFAAHQAQGTFLEDAGDDLYQSVSGVAHAISWDETCVVFRDRAGNDEYQTKGWLGGSAHNGMALFIDDAGDDLYPTPLGRARPNTYHGGHSFSLSIDLGGGSDVYGTTPPDRWNDRVFSKQDRAHVLDLPADPGPLETYVRAPESDAK